MSSNLFTPFTLAQGLVRVLSFHLIHGHAHWCLISLLPCLFLLPAQVHLPPLPVSHHDGQGLHEQPPVPLRKREHCQPGQLHTRHIQYMVQFLLSVVAMVVTIASCFIALWGFSLLTSLTMRRDLRTTQLQQLAIADMFYCFTFFCESLVDLSYELFGLDLTPQEMNTLCGSTFALYLSGRTVSLLLEVHIAVSFLFGFSSAWSWTLLFPWIVGVIAGVTQTVDLQPGEQNQDHFCDVSATYVFLGSPALLTVLGLNVAVYGLVVLRHKFSKLSVGRFLLSS